MIFELFALLLVSLAAVIGIAYLAGHLIAAIVSALMEQK